MKLKSIAHLCSSILLGFMASAGYSQEQLSAAPAVEAIGTKATQAALAPSLTDDPTATLPNAKPGECYAKVIIPAQYKADRVEVVEREASEKIEVIPAKYEWVEEKVLVKEATFKLETVPAAYADAGRANRGESSLYRMDNRRHPGIQAGQSLASGERTGRRGAC